jgi:hypothetical protein
MPQEQAVSIRRSLSRRRSLRSGVDTDDRGWTLLHIGARKGDLKEVSFIVPFVIHYFLDGFCIFAFLLINLF